MSLLTPVMAEMVGYADLATIFIETLFHVFSSLGAFLVQVIFYISSALLSSFLGVIDGVAIAFRDFLSFLEDVHQVSEETANAVKTSVFHFTKSTSDLCTCLCRVICTCTEDVLNVAASSALFVKQLLILVGNGTLFLLQLGPSALKSLFVWSYQSIVWTLQNMQLFLVNMFIKCKLFCSSLHRELSDMPLSSLIGLFLATLIILLLKYCVKSFSLSSGLCKIRDAAAEWCRRRMKARRATAAQLDNSCSSLDEPPAGCSQDSAGSIKSRSSLLKELEREREDKLCVICQDRFKCFILLPCRHFCLCQTCMEIVAESNPVCPICRQYVYDNLKIYG